MVFSVGDLAQRLNCGILGNAALELADVSPLAEAGAHQWRSVESVHAAQW